MKWRVIVVGKPALSWAKEGAADYLKRLSRNVEVEIVPVREGAADRVASAMLAAGAKTLRIALDEKGKAMRSLALAEWIKAREVGGMRQVSLFIGGADGLHQTVRDSADECWSLSSFTLQHELALVVVLEQIYRAYSINRGAPYHRE